MCSVRYQQITLFLLEVNEELEYAWFSELAGEKCSPIRLLLMQIVT